MPVIIAALLLAASVIAVRSTAIGLFIEAVGVNRAAASLAGIHSRLLLVAIYTFSGLCARISGLIIAGDIRGADATNAGPWHEPDALLAVVTGGPSLLGGRFSIATSVMGALLLPAVNTGILVSGLPPEFNLVVKAGVIILILLMQSPLAGRMIEARRNSRLLSGKAP